LGRASDVDALDVGCGPGETDRFLDGSFSSLHGVDISNGMIRQAAARNPWVNYRHYAEGEPLPYEDRSFDLAFAICVLHHVPPSGWDRFVSEMARVTRPGGLVALFEHNPWNPLTRKAVRNCSFDEDAVLVRRGLARRLLEGAGLERADSAYIVFFPREGPLLAHAERMLGAVPLGAQYFVAHRRPASLGGSR
jgi:SAM-dependent methyltransferase